MRGGGPSRQTKSSGITRHGGGVIAVIRLSWITGLSGGLEDFQREFLNNRVSETYSDNSQTSASGLILNRTDKPG